MNKSTRIIVCAVIGGISGVVGAHLANKLTDRYLLNHQIKDVQRHNAWVRGEVR